MARNGSKNSPTNAGGPRRPEGACKKLAEDFLADLERLWQQHGREVLQRLATERPLAFFQVMIKLARVQPLELGLPEESGYPCNREEVLQRLGDASRLDEPRLETRAGSTSRERFGSAGGHLIMPRGHNATGAYLIDKRGFPQH